MELEEAIKKLKTLNQERYDKDTILSLYNNFIDEDEENQPYILTPFERDAIEIVLSHLAKQEKMIEKIHENFCKFDWKNSNGEEVHNQLKELYESIFKNEEGE